MEKSISERVLDCWVQDSDIDPCTIRTYLHRLLLAMWADPLGNFTSKRPFGNSGWRGDLEKALVLGGIIPGRVDEDGYLEEVDCDLASELIRKAILELMK